MAEKEIRSLEIKWRDKDSKKLVDASSIKDLTKGLADLYGKDPATSILGVNIRVGIKINGGYSANQVDGMTIAAHLTEWPLKDAVKAVKILIFAKG